MKYNYLWNTLWALQGFSQALQQAVQPFCGRWGISPMQLRALLLLHAGGSQTATVLADSCGMAAGNCSAMCKKLYVAGLIHRRRSGKDERLVYISLTEKGGHLAESFEQEMNTALQAMALYVDEEDARCVCRALEGMHSYLEENKETPYT